MTQQASMPPCRLTIIFSRLAAYHLFSLSPHRYGEVQTLVAAHHGQLYLVTGWMLEAKIGQKLALGHHFRHVVYRHDDIADMEAGLAESRGALGLHVLHYKGQAVGCKVRLLLLVGGQWDGSQPVAQPRPGRGAPAQVRLLPGAV